MLLDRPVAAAPLGAPAPRDLAQLRLVCLVRAGDGYLVRAVGRLVDAGGPRRHLDISFGDAVDQARGVEIEAAVRQLQRWCDDGTSVSLVETGDRLALRAGDGTEVVLPAAA